MPPPVVFLVAVNIAINFPGGNMVREARFSWDDYDGDQPSIPSRDFDFDEDDDPDVFSDDVLKSRRRKRRDDRNDAPASERAQRHLADADWMREPPSGDRDS